jgi:hypothetical protein
LSVADRRRAKRSRTAGREARREVGGAWGAVRLRCRQLIFISIIHAHFFLPFFNTIILGDKVGGGGGKPNLIEFGGVTFVRGVHELIKTNFVKLCGQFVFTTIDQTHKHTHNPK